MTDPHESSLNTAEQLVSLADAEEEARQSERYRVLWQADSRRQDSACLTTGLPGVMPEAAWEIFRHRLIWWPAGVTERHRAGVISSRIGTRPDQHTWWFDLLRTAVLRVAAENECVLTVDRTAPRPAVKRACELFGIPHLDLTVDERQVERPQLVRWLADRIQASQFAASANSPHDRQAFVSPSLLSVSTSEKASLSPTVPVRDAVLCAAGHRSYVLSCRTGGAIHRLLRSWLTSAEETPSLVLIADGPGTPPDCRRELADYGAVPWLVRSSESPPGGPGQAKRPAVAASQSCDGPLECPTDWLCHWTRPCPGAWPGQPETEYLDELLLGSRSADRSALAALLRIVSHRRVLASVIRQQHRAVSFTEVPLAEFRQRRVYRRHRRRYDFEPWGVAVRRSVLMQLGARPVSYGTSDERPADENADSVWYQPAADRSGRIDWREEREWRIAEDLSLDSVPDSAVCLFVDSASEAETVSRQCSWPVIVLPSADHTER